MVDGTESSLCDLLNGSHWTATPDNYSSTRSLLFREDGTGYAAYAYGQTIYAVVNFRFEATGTDHLRLEYLPDSRIHPCLEFQFNDSNSRKFLTVQVTWDDYSCQESITGQLRQFGCRIDLSDSPWPDAMPFPYSVPKRFYGKRPRTLLTSEP